MGMRHTLQRHMITILVVTIALLFTCINSVGVFVGMANRPANTVYLGTIHYFEDYFLYLNHFFQGSHGAWLTANRYTGEITSPSILYWTDVAMGKLGGLIGCTPIVSYHIFLVIVTCTTLLVMYMLLTRIFPTSKFRAFTGFLFAVVSTSFINHIYVDGKPMWYPFQLWRTPHFALDRLGGVPHQTLQSLLFFVLTILCFSKNTSHPIRRLILIGICAFILTSLNPIQGAIFLGTISVTHIILYLQKKPVAVPPLIILALTTSATFIYMYFLSTTLPHSQARAWEATQDTTTTIPFLFMSMGPISFLWLLGIIPALMSGSSVLLFACILTVGTYAVFISTIPQAVGVSNLRILFPALYPFIGAIAVYGAYFIALKLTKFVPKMTTVNVITLFFILLSLPTLSWEIQQKIKSQADTADRTIYLPKPVYSMFTALSTAGTFDDVVLANPATHMDVLVPPLSGHTTYSGHMLLTINSGEKQTAASRFFALNTQDAAQWLKTNHIRYILFTPYDGDINNFILAYPFLKIYKGSGTAQGIFLVP